jgi:hypothetical protein
MSSINRDDLLSPLSYNGTSGFKTPTADIVGINLNPKAKHTIKSTY